jgi:molecular chaperone Hsp33
MIDRDHGAEAVCEFCGNVYRATREELAQLIDDLQTESSQG